MINLSSGFLSLLVLVHLCNAADSDYGVAIRYTNTTCPSGTFWIGTSLVPNCCPDGMVGAPKGSSYCCPSEDDCGTTVEQNIKCANTSWTYFPSPDNQPVGFCCLPDWVGYVQLNSSGDQLGVACETPGYVLDELQSTVPSIKLGSQSTSTTSSTVSTTPVTTSAQTTTEAVTTTSGGQTVAIPTETGIASSEASSNGSSGIGAGPIVGIVLGVIAVLSGLASFYYFWRKKRRAAAGLGPDDGTHGNAAMMAGYYEPVPETKQSTPYEMLATTPPVELDGGMRPELPTEWYGHEAGGTAKESQASRPAPL